MIIDLLLFLHKFLYSLNDNHKYKNTNKIMWLITNCGYRIFTWLLNKWIVLRSYCGIYSEPISKINEEIIISLTTFPARIDKVWMTIDSLMRQTVRPKNILLYLSEENFPEKDKALNKELTRYINHGLSIIWVKDDLRPHKKYLYAFNQFKDKCVVTVDDDLYYRKDMLERLINLHKKYPNAVCANNAKLIPDNINGELPLYKTWHRIKKAAIGNNIIGIGCGGILYPVNLFENTPYNKIELIKQLSLGTDDLWLKMMESIALIPVVTGDYNSGYPTIIGSQKNSLSKENWKKEDKNDKNWKLLNKHFKLDPKTV